MEHINSFIELDEHLLEELLTEEGKIRNISSAKISIISLISTMNATSAKMVTTIKLPRSFVAKYKSIIVIYTF